MTALAAGLKQALVDAVGSSQVLTENADTWAYGGDNSRKHAPPDAVVFADSHEQVLAVVRACRAAACALVARGRGTGTTGGCIPIAGGVVLSLERMNRVLEVSPADRLMVTEPGVTNGEVQRVAGEHGLFWAPDPSSADYCSVGGNLAFNAAGPRAVKYGSVRENVLGLRAVTGRGESIRTGVRTTKGVVGYDLTRLLVGSEGTLAIITEATLRLLPRPAALCTLKAVYSNFEAATAAIVRVMGQPVTPCALEFIDDGALELLQRSAQVTIPDGAQALLMVEVDGEPDSIDAAEHALRGALAGDGLLQLTSTSNPAERATLWETRKALSPALRHVAPNKINEDVVVPVSRMPELIRGLKELSQRYDIPIVNFGHAGNGNIHVNLLYDSSDPNQERAARPCLDEVFSLVLALDGTLSGEHGVGQEKRDFVGREIDATTRALMHDLRRQFDPDGILNPGKMLPPA
ncbi:MAG: FAD-binding protein [Gammaproteobacteria bacterium]|nr:FAD-binding protein [Gammaproteobacteria bacterium]